MTRRDLQGEMKKQGRPWEIGKAFEQSAPIGPIVPIGDTGAMDAGAITLDVNGQRRQSGDLKDLIWKVSETLDKLREAWSLKPGDLVFTGTPAGVGTVSRGDLMVARIAGLPDLRVQVI
jgi:fumarylpyruvate hydrolase